MLFILVNADFFSSFFFFQNEAMLVIKLYVKDLTLSELQAVFLGQLSTVAGKLMENIDFTISIKP